MNGLDIAAQLVSAAGALVVVVVVVVDDIRCEVVLEVVEDDGCELAIEVVVELLNSKLKDELVEILLVLMVEDDDGGCDMELGAELEVEVAAELAIDEDGDCDTELEAELAVELMLDVELLCIKILPP